MEVRSISKEYVQRDSAFTAIRDISLEVRKGSFTTIVGPSGCGKSTLLQLMAGLQLPSSGSVLLEGQEVTCPPFQAIYVFQQYTKSLFPWLSVKRNVAFGLENRGKVDSRAVRERCEEYIRLVGLEGFEDHYQWQLSGGMQQRVAIARALVCQPSILLMDEPFSSVDALTRSALQDLLLKIWKDLALTVIFVTHDIEEAIYLSQKVVVLTGSPSSVSEIVDIKLPYPRDQLLTRESALYLSYRRQLFDKVFGRTAVSS